MFAKVVSGKNTYMMVTKCCFTSTETVGLLGRGAQDVHFDFHTAPELCQCYIALVPVKYMLSVMLVGMQTVAMNFPPGERCKTIGLRIFRVH